MHYVHLLGILQKVSFQLMPENVETQCCITKTVWHWIQDWQARDDDHNCPVDNTEQSTSADGRPQMLMTGDVGCLCATVDQVHACGHYSGVMVVGREVTWMC